MNPAVPRRLLLALLVATRGAAAQEGAQPLALHELIPNPTFAEGASGWRLDHARALEDLGPEEQPVLELSGSPSGSDTWADVDMTVPGVAPGTELTLSARVQSLGARQSVWLALHAQAIDDGKPGWKDLDDEQESFRPPLDLWTDVSIRFVVPASTDVVQVRLCSLSERPILVTDVHLRPTHPGAPDASEPSAGLEVRDLESRVRAASAVTARLRHVTDWKPPFARLVDRATMARTIDMQFRGEAVRRAACEQEAFRQLGIWPADADLPEVQRHLTTTMVSGMYFPPANVILIAADTPTELLDELLIHESVHAIDSQVFRFWSGGMPRQQGDQETAFTATVEGSAVLVQLVDAASRGTLESRRLTDAEDVGLKRVLASGDAPPFFARRAVAPYYLGVHFLTRGAGLDADGRMPLDDIVRALDRPPTSTEQILHPAKYWEESERDDPRAVVLPDLSARLGDGWSLAGHGTLGELDLASMTDLPVPVQARLSEASSDGWISPITAGWGGDGWQSYRREADSVTILATLWDSAADAREFLDGVRRPAGAAIAQRDDTVVIVVDGRAEGSAGAHAHAADALVEAVLDSLQAR